MRLACGKEELLDPSRMTHEEMSDRQSSRRSSSIGRAASTAAHVRNLPTRRVRPKREKREAHRLEDHANARRTTETPFLELVPD